MRVLRWTAFILFGLLAAVGPVRPAGLQTLEIASKTGVHAFAVELVDNDADRAKGLMYRKELPEGRGMLFDFHREQEVAFWMQNTYIPLDMIFIRGDGRILRIAENTEPLSTRNHPLRRAGARGAGGDRRNRPQARHRARRPGGASDLQRALRLACWAGAKRVPSRITHSRGIAQSGSASGLGPEGRRFESCCPDHSTL